VTYWSYSNFGIWIWIIQHQWRYGPH